VTAEPDGPEDRLRRFATIWSRAVFPVTSTSLTRLEFEVQLLPLARRLSDALLARSFEGAEGQAVGAALVDAHCTDPEALSRTLDCVDAYLVLYCGEDGPQEALRTRSARLQHAMAAGFAQALRERTLAEQEAISRAALNARSLVAEALHASEARFRAVFEGAAIGIGIADLEGNILQVNGALLRMFGGSEQSMRGRRVPEWTHPDDAPQVWPLYEELVRGEREHYHVEKAFYRPDGTALWTNLTVSLLRDADGVPQGWVEMLRHGLRSLGPLVQADRMVGDYVTRLYAPAARASRALAADDNGTARRLAAWKARVRQAWSGVRIEHVEADGAEPSLGAVLDVRVTTSLGHLSAEDVCVEVVYGRLGDDDELVEPSYVTLAADDSAQAPHTRFSGSVELGQPGPFGYTVRVLPSHPLLASRADLGLVAYPEGPAGMSTGDLR